MNVKAHLKKPQENESAIVLTISDGRGISIKHYLGIVIPTKHWSRKQEKVLPANPNAVSYNKFIEERKKEITEIYLSFKAKGLIPTGKQINELIKGKMQKANASFNFWGLYELFMHQKKAKTSKAYEKKYLTLKKHLQAFEAYSRQPLELDKIAKGTFERLENYLLGKLNWQTTSRYLSFFKMFLNWCFENKHTQNTDFKSYKIASQPDTLKVALNKQELDQIRNLDLNGKGYLANVRKLFLLSCLVGLRYSDYTRIRIEHLKQDTDGNHYLQIRQQKTKDFVSIPLTDESLKLVRELITGKIKPISNQRMNEYIKELCQLAEIDEPFEITTFKGKTPLTYNVPKWKLISTHTARRTFATNLLLQGVPDRIVMEFTGHKDLKSFAKYINIPNKTSYELVRRAMNF